MGEAVLFLFINGEHVLLEFRMQDGREELLIPGGGIESFDNDSELDYREKAMHREIGEEMITVKAVDHEYIDSVTHEVTGSRFHMFIVRKWEGEIPPYTIEKGEPEGRLEWKHIDEALAIPSGNVSTFALQKAKAYLSNSK